MKKMKPNNNVAFIDGSMDLGAASPIEHEMIQETKRKKIAMNESELRNYIYEKVIKMLNEDMPMDPAAPMPPAGGAPMPPAAGGMPGAAPEDADKNPYKDRANKKKEEIAKNVGDNTGGAPGFNPQGPDDDKKKQMAKQVAESILRQIKEEYRKKK